MGTNTENGIWIFGITIRIYSNICFGRSCLCRFKRSFLCLGAGHIRILVYYTRSVSVAEIWSGVSINYLELVSLYMLNCLLATCYSRRRPSVYKLNSEASMLPVRRDISIKVSTVSWKPKAVVIKRFVVRHKSGIFCSQLLSNRQQNFKTSFSWQTDPLYWRLIQNNIAACRQIWQLFCHYGAMFYWIWYQILSQSKFWN